MANGSLQNTFRPRPIGESASKICIVIAVETDLHADSVVDKISAVIKVLRIDPLTDLPPLYFRSEDGLCAIGEIIFAPSDVSGIFCRFALEAINFDHIQDPVLKFSAKEHFAALVGLLLQVPEEKWVNFPWNEAQVEGKIYPLMLAKGSGISIPDFICACEVADLQNFSSRRAAIVKPLSDMSIAQQYGEFVEIPDLHAFEAPYTTDFDVDRMRDSDHKTPTLLQHKIEAEWEVRVTIIDQQIFSTKLERANGPIDSRLTKNRTEFPVDIPDEKAYLYVSFLKKELRLRFATLDFIVDAVNNFYLVDINPSGNWLWQENNLGLPISKSIAEALMS